MTIAVYAIAAWLLLDALLVLLLALHPHEDRPDA